METISLKIENTLLKEMDGILHRSRYSTRTEFIRDAIRDKLSDLEKEELLKAVAKLHGSSKHRTTDKQLHEARERVFEELEKYLKNKRKG